MTILSVLPVAGLPEVRPGDDVAALIADAVELRDRDVVVVAQKIVSKAEGALVDAPPARGPDDDPRRALARAAAVEIVADAPWALIVRTVHGLVCANAGIDASNVAEGQLSLLPDDPDASARALRAGLATTAGVDVAVIVADTFGRPWRLGQVDVAIGLAGLEPIRDERGGVDREGRLLSVTEAAVADALAAAADLVRSKAEGIPVVVIRGFDYEASATARARDLVRDPSTDLFAKGRGMLAPALQQSWDDDDVAPLDDADIVAVQQVAPDVTVTEVGPPTSLRVGDDFAAGLAVAVLVDRGAVVRWRRGGTGTIVESGRRSGGR